MILLAILRIGDEAYGVPIASEIERVGKRNVLAAVKEAQRAFTALWSGIQH